VHDDLGLTWEMALLVVVVVVVVVVQQRAVASHGSWRGLPLP
jgi:hypothetical protein